MLRALLGLFIALLVLDIAGVAMGFWKLYEIVPFWLFITSISVFGLLIVIIAVLVCKVILDLKAWLIEMIDKIKAFVDKLPKWLKKLLGIK